jgi:Cu/Ag efflux protein CusF
MSGSAELAAAHPISPVVSASRVDRSRCNETTLDGAKGMITRTLERCACAIGVILALTIGADAMDTAHTAKVAGDPQPTGRSQPNEAPKVFHGVGFVTAILPAGSLTINHQAIDGLMAAMEMTFSVNPPTLTRGIRPGDEVEFSVVGKTYAIVALKVVGHTQ